MTPRIALWVFVILVAVGLFWWPSLLAACVFIVLLPPHLDPAIRWKERNMRRRK